MVAKEASPTQVADIGCGWHWQTTFIKYENPLTQPAVAVSLEPMNFRL